MFRIRISVPTIAFRQELKRSLHTAMRTGAEGVQFDLRNEIRMTDFGETARRQLRHSLSELGLQAASVHFPLRSPLLDPDRLDERIAAIRQALEFAAHLRVRVLTLRAGHIPSAETAEYRDVLIPILNELAGDGNHRGVIPCLIPCGDPAESLRSLIEAVQNGPLGVNADLAGWVLSRQSPVRELRELHEFVQHVEIRDGVRDVGGLGKEVPVGRGEIDWDEVAGLLEEMNYSGWLNVSRTAGEDPVGDITRAIQYLRNLVPTES